MSSIITWANDAHTLIHQIYSDTFTLDDYRQAEAETQRLIAGEAHTVDILCDLQAARHLPSNLAALGQRPLTPLAPNMGVTIIVSAPPYVRWLATLADRLRLSLRLQEAGGHKVVFVDTLDEAYQALAQQAD